MLNSFRVNFANWLDPTRADVRARRASRLTVRETDDTITKGSNAWHSLFVTRLNMDREKILTQVINAYRTNPIAKRIIEITTEFAIGDGFGWSATGARLERFVKRMWNNPLNDLDTQITEWATEAWSTGDLFLIGSVDAGGMTYWRAMPAENITEIETVENDYRQERAYKRDSLDEKPYKAYNPATVYGFTDPARPGEKPESEFMLHFPLNRVVGSCFGESDLGSVLYWILLYKQWLEDRARLNFFRQLFTFILQRNWTGNQAEKDKYVAEFMARLPKKSGGVLALDADEILGTLNPNLASFEAEQDGLAIKRMIVTGVGMVMHWFAEPEGSTRTTAEAAGTPSFKRFQARQRYLVKVVQRVVQVSIANQRHFDTSLPANPTFTITAPDITERDNANLSLAVLRIVQAFAPLYNAKKISAKETMRIVWRFLGEVPPEGEPDPDMPIIMSGSAGGSRKEPEEKETTE